MPPTDDELKSLAKVVAFQAETIFRLKMRVASDNDFSSAVNDALSNVHIDRIKDKLDAPRGTDFDYDSADKARKEMFKAIEDAADAGDIMKTVMKFALAIGPML